MTELTACFLQLFIEAKQSPYLEPMALFSASSKRKGGY